MKKLYAYSFLNGLQFTYTTWLAFVILRGGNPGWAEAFYHLGILVGEVPTGAVADLFGRRKSMLTGLLISAAVAGGYSLIHGTVSACLLMFISGLSTTFLSGADTALLYETAVEEGGAEYAQKAMARANALQIGALALAPALAGFMYQWNPLVPSLAKGITALVTVAVVWGIKDRKPELSEKPGIIAQTRAAVRVVRGNRLALTLILFGWVYNTANAMAFQFGQAYLPYMGMAMGGAGIVFALSQSMGTVGSSLAERLSRVAAGRALRFGPLLAALCFALMGLAGSFGAAAALVGAACLVLAGVADGVIYPIHSYRLNEAIPSEQRATILSMHSAGFSMMMTFTFPAASYLPIPAIYLTTGLVALAAAVVWMARRWSY
ncbi:MAG TPA: MFS transporter [Symbiobacteriaceae bacterium]|nr:MFS transporter [Symbiobacteriaceae bacterium]